MSNLAMMMGLGSGRAVGVEFVGSVSAPTKTGSGALVYDLSSIDIQAGDMLIISHTVGEDADRTSVMSLQRSGYTTVATLFGNDTYDINLACYIKICDGSETIAETTSGGGLSTSSNAGHAMVFRGTNGVIPTNAATGLHTSTTASNTDDISWPSVNPSGNCLVYIGSTGHISGAPSYTTPSDMTLFIQSAHSATEDCTAGMGYLINPPSPFQAETWLLSANGSSSAVAYIILDLSA